MSLDKYVHETARNFEAHLGANFSDKYRLLKRVDNPFKMGYDPELDINPELEPDSSPYVQTIIGILRWMIELGRINIIKKVSLWSSHLALLGEGHFDAAVHVMACVGQKYNSSLVYDLSYPEMDHSIFKKYDWSEFYQDTKEALQLNATETQGKEVDICMFVNSDHVGDKVYCRLRTGFLVYVNTALVQWFSKEQTTVETSVLIVSLLP